MIEVNSAFYHTKYIEAERATLMVDRAEVLCGPPLRACSTACMKEAGDRRGEDVPLLERLPRRGRELGEDGWWEGEGVAEEEAELSDSEGVTMF